MVNTKDIVCVSPVLTSEWVCECWARVPQSHWGTYNSGRYMTMVVDHELFVWCSRYVMNYADKPASFHHVPIPLDKIPTI